MARWLNVWCICHTYLETLQECQSHRQIGWIIQDFWETCVSRSLSFCLDSKMPWGQTLSRKKKAVVFTTLTTRAYQDQLNTGFSNLCEIFKVHDIESLKVLHTGLLLWRYFHPLKRDAELKRTVIGCLTCQSNGLMGGPWPMKAAIYSRPSAVSLHETTYFLPCWHFSLCHFSVNLKWNDLICKCDCSLNSFGC